MVSLYEIADPVSPVTARALRDKGRYAAFNRAPLAPPSPRFLDNASTPNINGATFGAVAQMGERCNRTAEVRGSIPLGSTR